MKLPELILLLTIAWTQQRDFAGETQHGEWGAETNGIRMSIELDESCRTNPANHEVVLLCRLNNVTTNQTFEIYESNKIEFGDSYSFEYVLPSGKKLTPPAMPGAGSGGFLHIEPQKTKQFQFNLQKLFRFDEAGTYQITAKRLMVSPTTGKPFKVVSNSLKIELPAPAKSTVAPKQDTTELK